MFNVPLMAQITMHLAKENFKFSAAHFLIFDEQRAERLHGHNYQVRVDVEVPAGALDQTGFFIDFADLKKEIKALVDGWDEAVLLPERHPDMKIQVEGASLRVNFRERTYVFPRNEVILLPLTNTSVEQLSRLLGETLFARLSYRGVRRLTVFVEETRGQGASATLTL